MLTHVYLVSSQATPNLTPALDRHTAPQRVILIVSPGMAQQADWLEAVLSPRLKTVRWQVPDPFDVELLQLRFLELLEAHADLIPAKQIVLNATGGTKPMSIAAYEAFRAYDLPIFYIHPEKDRLIWLHPGEWTAVDLADRVKLEHFLAAHGVSVHDKPVRNVPDQALLQVGEAIVHDLERFQKPLGTLNWLAASAERNLRSSAIKNDHGELRQLIDLFEMHEILRRKQGSLQFASEAHRFFTNGGWLEYLVFDAVRRLRKKDMRIHDVVRSVQVARVHQDREVYNELDVVFLRDNRLHIIECKTRQFKGRGEDSPGAETLYKLDTLGDVLGGLQARSMLVSYQQLRKADIDRAASLGISVCHGEQLQRLEQHLSRLVSGDFSA